LLIGQFTFRAWRISAGLRLYCDVQARILPALSTSAHSRSMMRVRRGTEYRVTAFTRFISATVIQRNSLADERDDMEERAVGIFVSVWSNLHRLS
jgi:hypothetical protein